MEFKLRENTNISIIHRHKEVSIDIEDSYGTLEEDLLTQIFENSGNKHLKKTLTEDMFIQLLLDRTEELHEYLSKCGYIFNKA